MSIKRIIKKLESMNWHLISIYSKRQYNFEYDGTNRYLELSNKYLDVYVYKDGEKYKGYLSTEELEVFYKLSKKLKKIV